MKRLVLIVALVTLLFLVDVSTAQGNAIPDSAYISGLTGHPQGYNLSCESRSAADLAAFWGLSIGETEFLQALPHSDNPETGFVGNPNEAWGFLPPHGYGVHASPVADVLKSYGLEAIGLSNLSWDDLRGEISAGHARALLAVTSPSDQQLLFDRVVKRGLSVRETEQAAAALSQGKRSGAGRRRPAGSARDPNVREVEERLVERFGTKVQIRGGPSRGRIEIAYFSADDLERVLELLQGRK